jgi:hypothetical protein
MRKRLGSERPERAGRDRGLDVRYLASCGNNDIEGYPGRELFSVIALERLAIRQCNCRLTRPE